MLAAVGGAATSNQPLHRIYPLKNSVPEDIVGLCGGGLQLLSNRLALQKCPRPCHRWTSLGAHSRGETVSPRHALNPYCKGLAHYSIEHK
jgi:hypothetical protein